MEIPRAALASKHGEFADLKKEESHRSQETTVNKKIKSATNACNLVRSMVAILHAAVALKESYCDT
jgi:hypothetical protein